MKRKSETAKKVKGHRTGECQLPRYDWTKDPNNYLDEHGRVPQGRCFHCGSRYANPSVYSAFCRDCWADLNMDVNEPKAGYWAMINSRIRLKDETPGDFKRGDGTGL